MQCHWDVERSGPSAESPDQKPIRVCFLTEQTSHHPPISAFYVDCKEKGITAKGYDQISAKFTGTSIKVSPGNHNLGIFINIHNDKVDEVWNLTHPAAHLGGLITGALSITVQDICYVTCPKLKLKVILHYLTEPWVGRSKYKVEGVIFNYDPANDNITQDKKLIIDVKPLFPATKFVPSEEDQLENESRKMWQKVTDAILGKDYALATKLKIEIEDQKRKEAAEREAEDKTWEPKYFVVGDEPGIPTLKPTGQAILNAMSAGDYHMPAANSTS
ncbi:hypothetical protein ABW20_dc0105035 [Dactylellina cionopaga]|nr:hypothetical protein ABW20_dc0105035 [Dactylellina cionopaga]